MPGPGPGAGAGAGAGTGAKALAAGCGRTKEITGAAAGQAGTSQDLPALSPGHAVRMQKRQEPNSTAADKQPSVRKMVHGHCAWHQPCRFDQAMHERHLQVGAMPTELLWWQGPQSPLGQLLCPQVSLWSVLQRRRRVNLSAQGQPWLAQLPVWWLLHLMREPELALWSQVARWCLLQLLKGALLAEGYQVALWLPERWRVLASAWQQCLMTEVALWPVGMCGVVPLSEGQSL